jgi:HEAT repeat protein
MSFLPPLPPTFEAALRDVRARKLEARMAAAAALADPPAARRADALSGLLELAADRDARVRGAAVKALQMLGDRGALPELIARMEDGDGLVRELAVVALGSLGGRDACDALRTALRSHHPEVRFQAVVSYVEACAAPVLSALKPLLRDEDPKVRANAARSLVRFGAEARGELQRALDDPEPHVRAEAALALARLGESPDEEALRPALSDPELLPDALDAVARFELRALQEEVAALALSVLKPLPLKAAAARALLRLGDPRGVPALRGVLRAFRGDGRSYAVEIAGELQVRALVPELLRLSRWLRGTDPAALTAALSALLPLEPAARKGLERLARRDDDAGEQARQVLARAPRAGAGR